MARRETQQRKILVTVLAWADGPSHILPDPLDGVDQFQDRGRRHRHRPASFSTGWTTEANSVVQSRSDYVQFAMNSVILALGSTFFALVIAIPSAWAMAFAPGKRTKDLLMWMLSTKMMPPVGALIPIYLIFRDFGLLDTRGGIITVLMLLNLPIIIWMLYTYFKEIPGEILEASRMDGASLGKELLYVLTPMAIPGIASTLLLNIILAWNEAFWTLALTTKDAAPLTQFIASYSSPEGLFWAKLSAASTMAIAPILVLGWFAQKQLVRGLTFGAVK